jgi:pilus assembly protein Flp/PilA
MSFLKNFYAEECGQDMVEYGLILGLVVLAAIAAFTTFGGNLSTGITDQAGKVATNVK